MTKRKPTGEERERTFNSLVKAVAKRGFDALEEMLSEEDWDVRDDDGNELTPDDIRADHNFVDQVVKIRQEQYDRDTAEYEREKQERSYKLMRDNRRNSNLREFAKPHVNRFKGMK